MSLQEDWQSAALWQMSCGIPCAGRKSEFVFVEEILYNKNIRKSIGYSLLIHVLGAGGIVMRPAPVTGHKR